MAPHDPEAAAHFNAIEKTRDPSHQRAYNESEWVAIFREAGLLVERVEHFRKRREFDFWAGMQGVDAPTRERLRAMFHDAPPGAKTALAPEEHEGRLSFYLDEILILASSAPRA